MTGGGIDYAALQRQAMTYVIRWALERAASPSGLPGDHHFYLTFATGAPGVLIPDFLRKEHPEHVTIVIKSRFRDLMVDDEGFSVGLWFEGREADLRVPFSALTQFVDPSASFVIRFEPVAQAAGARLSLTRKEDGPRPDAEVVSLEDFRKTRDED